MVLPFGTVNLKIQGLSRVRDICVFSGLFVRFSGTEKLQVFGLPDEIRGLQFRTDGKSLCATGCTWATALSSTLEVQCNFVLELARQYWPWRFS